MIHLSAKRSLSFSFSVSVSVARVSSGLELNNLMISGGLHLNFDFYLITLHANNPKEHINAGITNRKKFIKFCVDKVGKHVHVHVGERNILGRQFEQLI